MIKNSLADKIRQVFAIGTFRPTEIGRFLPTQNGRFLPTLTEGEYYTPHDVVQLIAAMIEPFDGTLYENCTTSLIRIAAA